MLQGFTAGIKQPTCCGKINAEWLIRDSQQLRETFQLQAACCLYPSAVLHSPAPRSAAICFHGAQGHLEELLGRLPCCDGVTLPLLEWSPAQ